MCEQFLFCDMVYENRSDSATLYGPVIRFPWAKTIRLLRPSTLNGTPVRDAMHRLHSIAAVMICVEFRWIVYMNEIDQNIC